MIINTRTNRYRITEKKWFLLSFIMSRGKEKNVSFLYRYSIAYLHHILTTGLNEKIPPDMIYGFI